MTQFSHAHPSLPPPSSQGRQCSPRGEGGGQTHIPRRATGRRGARRAGRGRGLQEGQPGPGEIREDKEGKLGVAGPTCHRDPRPARRPPPTQPSSPPLAARRPRSPRPPVPAPHTPSPGPPGTGAGTHSRAGAASKGRIRISIWPLKQTINTSCLYLVVTICAWLGTLVCLAGSACLSSCWLLSAFCFPRRHLSPQRYQNNP